MAVKVDVQGFGRVRTHFVEALRRRRPWAPHRRRRAVRAMRRDAARARIKLATLLLIGRRPG